MPSADAAASDTTAGPFFRACDTVTPEELRASGEDVSRRLTPVLIKGATLDWPAATRWDFEHLAAVCGDVRTSFYDGGPAEQGATPAPLTLPVAPYLQRLAALPPAPAPPPAQCVVLPLPQRAPDTGAAFALNWAFAPQPREPYLAQWSILDAFPRLRADLRVRALWPSRWRLVWEHVFLGPAGTVTGLHYDWNPNIFTNVRGEKDWLLFPPGRDNDEALQPSRKFDWGATCSSVDVSRLAAMPASARARFAAARGGVFARVGPGDALVVPPGTWHAVVARTPCISVSVFGLTLWQVCTTGLWMTLLAAVHAMGLYRRGNCTCCRNTAAADSNKTD